MASLDQWFSLWPVLPPQGIFGNVWGYFLIVISWGRGFSGHL